MPAYTFQSPHTGESYDIEFDGDPNEADLEEVRLDLEKRERDTGQGQFDAAMSNIGRGALSVPKGIVGGVGEIAGLIPGLDDNLLQRGAESFQESYEGALPVNPALEDSFIQKAAGAAGQGAGMLGLTLGTAGFGATPAIARAAGLGTAGLMGAEQGGDIVDRYDITDPWKKAAAVLGSAAIETVTEMPFGAGSKNFTEALLGQMKSATRPGNIITRGAKTAFGEVGEEIVAGQGGDLLTKAIVDEDPNRPGFAINGAPMPPDILSMENLYNRLEEGALGAVGGTVFAGAEALGSQTPVNEALSLRMQARSVLDDLQAKETLTPEEQAQLTQLQAEDANVSAWLERQGFEAVRPALDQVIASPEVSEQEREQAIQYASLIDNLQAVEAAPDATPEEVEVARAAVSDHPLNKRENRFNKANQDLSIKGTYKEKYEALKKQVQEYVGDADAAPDTVAAVSELITSTPETDAEQTQASTAASLTPATAQAAAAMGVQPETADITEPVDAGVPAEEVTPTQQTDAIQIQEPAQSLLREEGSQMGLPTVGEGNQEQEAAQQGVPQEVTLPPDETTPPIQEQPQSTPDAAQQVPVAESPQSGSATRTGVSGQPPISAPKLSRKRTVLPGVKPSSNEISRAVVKMAKLGNVRLATVEELSTSPEFQALWGDNFDKSGIATAEAFSDDGNGNMVIIPQNVAVYAEDVQRGKSMGITGGEAAIIRLIMHENWHGVENWINTSPEAAKLKQRYDSILNEITTEELDSKAQRGYSGLSDWRNNPQFKRILQSEVMAERRETAELTGEPDSLIEKFFAWLRDVLKAVTGTTQEPTPDELQDLFEAWYRAQKAAPTRAGPQASQPEMTPEQLVAKNKELSQQVAYEAQEEEAEGLDPTKATRDERTYTSGTDVKKYRKSSTNAGQNDIARQALTNAIAASPDGPSQEFGYGLLGYLQGKVPEYYGMENSPFMRSIVGNYLENNVQTRSQLGIDGGDLESILETISSRAGATLQARKTILEPMRKLKEKAKELDEKAQKEEEINVKDVTKTVQDAYVKNVQDMVPDVMAVLPVLTDAAQNQADAQEDLFELGFEGMDPKIAGKIRELNERVARRGKLLQMRARLLGAQKGPAASLPELPENLTLAQIEALLKEEDAAIAKLTDEITKAEKKAKAKPREKKPKKQKVTDNVSFHDYANGKETAGVQPFDALMKKNITAAGFNRDSMFTSLSNAFKNADPNFILGVVTRVGDMLDGAATEEGIEEDAKRAVNYDARAKRLVATNIARQSTDETTESTAEDPFVALTARRLKGEVSAADYQKGLQDLGVEEQTAFAMLQKVDQDRARIGDMKAQREVNAQYRKDMAAFQRASERSEREAMAKIASLANQFTDTPNFTKEQATTELKAISDSFLGKSGPPISEEQFLERAAALNIKPQTADNLLKLLSESRRRNVAVRYAKASQKAQEAKTKAIDVMVKKLGKVKNPTPKKLRQRSTFVNSVMGALETGILDTDAVTAAFAEAYDLHGLTPERLKEMGDLLQKIESMKEGIPKESFLLQFNSILNSIAPTASFVTHAHSALMGYVLSGVGTMAMQLTGVNRYINPLAGTVEILWSAPGTATEKLGRTLNPKNFFRIYMQGMKEVGENLQQGIAGLSGVKTSVGQGLGAIPSSLASVTPRDTSLAYTPFGQISKYRFNTPKLLKAMGLDKMVQATRYPAWMASRSFQVIRAAEGIIGGADKNMQFRAQMAYALMQSDPKLSFNQAYSKVSDALGDQTTEMWKEAYKQADGEISNGLVAKASRKQRATELAQDFLEEKWAKNLANRPREIAALYGYKQDPITPLGAWLYKGVSGVLNKDKGPLQALKFSFLFARFFTNAIETAYSRTPLGGLGAMFIDTAKSEGKFDEREKRIIQMFGSLQGYKDARIARSISGTAVMGGIAGLMVMALKGWDPDDDEPPFFWITGDPIGEFSKKGSMEAGGWYKSNTLYIGPVRINYVNASPEYAMVMSAMGSMGDRFMYDKLLNFKENKETGEYERSNYQAYGKPVLEAMAAPISRSTFRQWYDMLEAAYDGDFTKLTKAVSNPAVGTAVALSPAGLIPSIKTLEKIDRSSEQPRTAKTPAQAAMGSVPFADELGLDAGKPLTTPFGNPLTPYPFWSVLSNSQEVPPEVSRAARTLTNLGVYRLGTREEYFGWGMAEIASDGKKYLLGDAERGKVLQDIGRRFASKINNNSQRLRKLEKEKDGRNKVRDAISDLASKARSEALYNYKPTR